MPQHPIPRERRFRAGETIIHEGAEAQHLYIIRSGRVRVVKQGAVGEVILNEFGAGNIFGEMALIDRSPRSAGVVAIEATLCIEMPYLLVEDLVERSSPWIAAMLRILVLRLRHADEAVSGLRRRAADSGEMPIDEMSERHLRRIVRKLEDSALIEWDRISARMEKR